MLTSRQDQPFWGSMVSRAGAGADEAIPYKHLSIDALAEGIKQCLSPEAKASAEKIADSIAEEGDGAKNAVESFHRHLPLRGEFSMRCTIFADRVAVWLLKDTRLRLSTLAAQLFINQKRFRWQDLRLIRHYEWGDFEGPGEPITGGGAALAKTAGGVAKGIGGVPVRWARSLKKHQKHEKQVKQRPRSSANVTSPRKSGEARSPDRQTAKDDEGGASAQEEQEQRSHRGPSCAEYQLPEANTIGRVASDIHSHGNVNTVGPLPSTALGSEEDDTVSSADSDDNIAQDLAQDAGAGLAKSGQAIAKGNVDVSRMKYGSNIVTLTRVAQLRWIWPLLSLKASTMHLDFTVTRQSEPLFALLDFTLVFELLARSLPWVSTMALLA